ncbi:MAG: hypothetical protein ACPGJV_09420 [Bacteriovoracaceae bacterium]
METILGMKTLDEFYDMDLDYVKQGLDASKLSKEIKKEVLERVAKEFQ